MKSYISANFEFVTSKKIYALPGQLHPQCCFWKILSHYLTCNHVVTYNVGMEAEHVFKAVADHHRRHLLRNSLTETDGQTLTQLCAAMPMSRIGVMKHLDILEQAGLITPERSGVKNFIT